MNITTHSIMNFHLKLLAKSHSGMEKVAECEFHGGVLQGEVKLHYTNDNKVRTKLKTKLFIIVR